MTVTSLDLLGVAFTAPMPATTFNTEITNFYSYKSAVQEPGVWSPDDIWDYESNYLFEDSPSVSANIWQIPFSVSGKQGAQTVAYKSAFTGTGAAPNAAILLIPGSGDNQVGAVVAGTGYHGTTLANMNALADTFVYMRHGHDQRAQWGATPAGNKRIGDAFYDAAAIAEGGSLHTCWLVEIVALYRYLKTQYAKVGIAGLSQGAMLAAVAALAASPDFVICASGFSLNDYRCAGLGTLSGVNVPGLQKKWPQESLISRIKAQPTEWLITHSSVTTSGVSPEPIDQSSWEESMAYTEGMLEDAANVTVHSHDQGHAFPQPFTGDFIGDVFDGSGSEEPPPSVTGFDPANKASNLSLSGDNNEVVNVSTGGWGLARGSKALTAGKWYWEMEMTAFPSGDSAHQHIMPGIVNAAASVSNFAGGSAAGASAQSECNGNTSFLYNGVTPNFTGSWGHFDNGDVIGFAFDRDAGKLYVSRNGTWYNSANPGSGTGHWLSGLSSGSWYPAGCASGAHGAASLKINTASFRYTPPSGFSAYDDA